MAQTDGISTVLFRYGVDQASISKIGAANASVRRDFQSINSELATTSETTKRLAQEFDILKRAAIIDQVVAELHNAGKATGDLDEKVVELEISLRSVGASSQEIDLATEAFKRFSTQVADTNDELKLSYERGSRLSEIASSRQFRGGELDSFRNELFADPSSNDGSGGSTRRGGGLGGVTGLRRTGGALTSLGLGAIGGPVSTVGEVAQVAKEIQLVTGALTTAGPAAEGAAVGATALGAAVLPIAVIGTAAAVALVAVSEGLKKDREEADRQIAVLDKFYETLRSGNATITEKQIADTKENIKLLEDQLVQQKKNKSDAALKASGGKLNVTGDPFGAIGAVLDSVAGSAKEWNDAITKSEADLKKAKTDLEGMTQALPELKILRAVAVDIDIVKTAVDNFSKASEQATRFELAYNNAIIGLEAERYKAEVEARKKAAADAKAFSDTQDQEALAAVKNYESAKAKAVETERAAEADAQQKYSAKVADILQSEIDAADAALQKLQEREADLQTNAIRDEDKAARKAALDDVQAQIKARRTERDDLTAHLRKVREIQNHFASDERDAILDRNFLQLFKLQEGKKEQTAAENTAYDQQKADRAQSFADAQEDTARQRTAEAKERKIALQNALSDAQRGYQRELAAAQQKRDRALQIAANERDAAILLAQQKYIATINIETAAVIESIRLANLSAEERKRIMREELAYAQSLGFTGGSTAGGFTSGGGNYTVDANANGGSVRAGHPFIFNELGSSRRETVNIGGKSFGSNGTALVFPLRDGSVDANRGGGGNTIHLSIPVSVDARGATDGRALGNQVVAIIQREVPQMVIDVVAPIITGKAG